VRGLAVALVDMKLNVCPPGEEVTPGPLSRSGLAGNSDGEVATEKLSLTPALPDRLSTLPTGTVEPSGGLRPRATALSSA
jgi:hypothetical protein